MVDDSKAVDRERAVFMVSHGGKRAHMLLVEHDVSKKCLDCSIDRMKRMAGNVQGTHVFGTWS